MSENVSDENQLSGPEILDLLYRAHYIDYQTERQNAIRRISMDAECALLGMGAKRFPKHPDYSDIEKMYTHQVGDMTCVAALGPSTLFVMKHLEANSADPFGVLEEKIDVFRSLEMHSLSPRKVLIPSSVALLCLSSNASVGELLFSSCLAIALPLADIFADHYSRKDVLEKHSALTRSGDFFTGADGLSYLKAIYSVTLY